MSKLKDLLRELEYNIAPQEDDTEYDDAFADGYTSALMHIGHIAKAAQYVLVPKEELDKSIFTPNVTEEEIDLVTALMDKHSEGLLAQSQPMRNLVHAVLVSWRGQALRVKARQPYPEDIEDET